jgi:hypothetical protein
MAILEKLLKKLKKILEKVCTFENYPYLCIRNHEKSSL